MKNYGLLVLIILLSAATSFGANTQAEITLEVVARGARPNVGQALFALFDSKETFLKKPLITKTQTINEDGIARFRIEGLPSGQYAMSVAYDEDSNGKLNTGIFGIPKEKVGVSNNPKARFGPPKFKDSVFELTKDTKLVIILGKAKD